ncbi:hypothetical protein [Thalassotalea aquiviva]|uniref:hypothetical protein n=1 Tax=Thalassotalea aquiviva TaxID=3242415 RepID=UPI00352A1DB7
MNVKQCGRYLLVMLSLALVGCGGSSSSTTQVEPSLPETSQPPIIPTPDPLLSDYSTSLHYIEYLNDPFDIKAVVYVPAYPGYLPWELEQQSQLPESLQTRIDIDIANIKNMGANTIRFWGAPEYCYQALKKQGDLHFIQTIWIDSHADDYQDPGFKQQTKAYIREVIDRIYGVYPEQKPPLIAYLVGNELSDLSIIKTNNSHPNINSYQGKYIKTTGQVSATEAFIAEMADYVKTYEAEQYHNISLVSYANDIRTFDLIDTPFLDFRSHNAYSYAIPYYRPNTMPGLVSGHLFQGWIEEIKQQHPNMPLLITETGLSVSPNAYQAGPPNFGYGGNSEEEQSVGLVQNLKDIYTASLPIAGVTIHEYLDAWWKFGLEDSYSQDPNDIEEWFGLTKLKAKEQGYRTEFRPAYHAIADVWLNQ